MYVKKIKAVLQRQDPYEVAKVLTLPSLSNQNRGSLDSAAGGNKQRPYNERVTINDVDWSALVNSFLEARDCALAVSVLTIQAQPV